MKKIFKSRLFAFFIGALIFGGIGVYAAVTARSVTYNNANSGLKDSEDQDVTNVQDAIDALNRKTNNFNSILDTSLGSQVSVGGYLWHIIGEDDTKIWLLMDQEQIQINNSSPISRTYLCDLYSSPNCGWNGSTYTYSWGNSTISAYLNGTFYNSLPANIKAKIVETKICNGASNGQNSYSYGGYTESEVNSLSAQNAACPSGYTSYKVRLITPSEYHNIVNSNVTYPVNNGYYGYFADVDYINQNLSGSWLNGSTSTYHWWTTGTVSSGGGGWERKAFYVKNDGSLDVADAYSNYEVRPVIVIQK